MRSFRRILIIFLVLLLVVPAALLLLSWIYEKEVKEYLVSQLNRNLKTKVLVEPDAIQFSLLSDFPMASLNFDRIVMLGSPLRSNADTRNSKPRFFPADTLFSASRISMQFSLWQMMTGDYSVRTLSAENGRLFLRRGWANTVNWEVWSGGSDSTDTDTDSSAFRIELMQVKNLQAAYRDLRSGDEYSFLIREGKAEGEFTASEYEMNIKADLHSERVRIDSVDYLASKDLSLDFKLLVNARQGLYTFTEASAHVADLKLNVQGSYTDAQSPSVDLRLKGEEMDIVSLLSLLPADYQHYVKDYDSDGDIYGEVQIKGRWEGEGYPSVRSVFGIRNADILQLSTGITLKKTNLEGEFFYSAAKSYLDLRAVSAEIRNGSLKGNLRLDHLSAPVVKSVLRADLPLEDIRQLLKIDSLWGYPMQALQGKMRLNVDYQGKLPDGAKYRASDFNAMNLAGDLTLENAGLAIKNSTLRFDSVQGSFVFNDNDVEVISFSGRSGRSDFHLKGFLRNFLAYTMTDAADLGIDASFSAGRLELDEFLVNQTATTRRDTVYRVHFSPHLDFDLQSDIGELKFRKFTAKEVKGVFRLRNGKLIADPVSFQAVDGKVVASGMLDANRDSVLLLSLDANLNRLNINKLFYQFEDFGQDVISHQNLRGIGTATVQLAMVMLPDLSIDPARIYVRSNMLVEKGQLLNYEPMRALSKYISVAELEDIRFSTLHNQIEIMDQTIHIPKMDILSSALDVTLNGTHTFSNVIDYHIKVLMSDVLFNKARKAKKENDEFGVIEDDKEGRTSLFISMTGTVDEPVFKYDRKEAAKNLKENISSERQTLKQILKDEFGWFKKDTTGKGVKTPPRDDKFILQWEDEEKKPKKDEDEDF